MTPETNAQEIKTLEVMPAPSAHYVQEAENRSLNFLNPKLWQAMKVCAEVFMQSGALPSTIKNAPQLMMVLQAGYEAGLQPLEAMNSFYFVNGKLSMYGEMAIALVMRRGHKVQWDKCDATTATVKITRGDNGMELEQTFTMAEAKARKLDMGREGIKEVWAKFPENMLRFKVFHMTATFIVPDAFSKVSIGEIAEEEVVAAKVEALVTAKAVEAKAVEGRKTLQEALETPEPQVEVKEPPKAKKKSKDEESDAEVKVEEIAKPEETDQQRYDRLVDEELKGRNLEPKEKMFIGAYRAKTPSAE